MNIHTISKMYYQCQNDTHSVDSWLLTYFIVSVNLICPISFKKAYNKGELSNSQNLLLKLGGRRGFLLADRLYGHSQYKVKRVSTHSFHIVSCLGTDLHKRHSILSSQLLSEITPTRIVLISTHHSPSLFRDLPVIL